jgi:uncharacterized protein with HEPN domain
VNEAAASALRVMRANAQIALEYARDHPDWRQNRLVVDAIAKRVEEVAEAAKTRFPRALRGDYPDIEWDEIAGMRDHLAHEYGNVDLDILAEVVDHRLPRLVSSIDEILAE